MLPFPTVTNNDGDSLKDAINQISRVRLQDIGDNNNLLTKINSLNSGGVTSFTGDGVLLSNTSSTGAVTASLGSQSSHLIFASPVSSSGPPTFRALTLGDLPTFSPITGSLSADVSCTSIASFFDGPSVSQGTVGTWFASGQVNLIDTVGANGCFVKLWDGFTVINSCEGIVTATNTPTVISLSGYIANPSGNLRISVQFLSDTHGVIKFNQTGYAKDSTITAFRLA